MSRRMARGLEGEEISDPLGVLCQLAKGIKQAIDEAKEYCYRTGRTTLCLQMPMGIGSSAMSQKPL